MERLARWIPLAGTLRAYDSKALRGDLGAGLTTAVMLIPQAMAYAMLAGLPPIVGLYASTFPLFVYALVGSSRQLAVGPVAMDSLLVATGVGAIAATGTDEYIALATALALMVGVVQLVLGLARAGFLVNFLSRPVISGFTSAAALIIGLSQLQHLLGLELPRTHHVHRIAWAAIEQAASISWPTVGVGVGAIAILLGLERWAPKLPRALVAVLVTTLVVWGAGLHERGVAIVGSVPAGLPSPAVPDIDLESIGQLWASALTIALVAFMEAISVSKAIASRHRYDVDPNRELVGIGLANIVGGFTRAYPITGGFSRSAVNDQAGARTAVAGMITATVVIVTLLFLTPLFYYLPKATLAAVIMTAVFGLIDLVVVRRLWRIDRGDLGLLALTFVATLSLGIEPGIAVGVGASLLVFVVRTTRPHTAVLGRLPGSEVYRNVLRFPEVIRRPGVVTLRIDAQFYFGNVTFLKEAIAKHLAATPDARAVVIDASSVNRLDSSAGDALIEIVTELERDGVELHFAGVKGPVRDFMARSGFTELLGPERFHLRVHEAVEEAYRRAMARREPQRTDTAGSEGPEQPSEPVVDLG